MKARELIKLLSECPDCEVELSVDVSTGDEDYYKRAFGDEIYEVIQNRSRKILIILVIGKLNF